MSQERVLKLLEKGEEMTTEEIVEKLDITFSNVWKNLSHLLEQGLIIREKISKEDIMKKGKRYVGRHYLWKIKDEK